MITVHLPKFEGPLDLLLYLIRKEEMDIFDIKIHEITRQYLEYIKMMRELDLEVAGDFISMASTLIHIKSRMLLPQYNEQGDLIENEDPRKELVQRLIEYQKFQEAAKKLSERPWVGRDVWARGSREIIKPLDEDIELEENALFSLISSYRAVIRSFQKKIHRIAVKAQSIASRILEMKDRLVVGQRTLMSSLITAYENRERQVLITFLSLLELGKMGFVQLYQPDTFGEIYVDTRKEILADVLYRVEEFDGQAAQQARESLFEKSEGVALESDDGVAVESFSKLDETQLMSEYEKSMDLEVTPEFQEMATDEEILAAEKDLFEAPLLSEDVVNVSNPIDPLLNEESPMLNQNEGEVNV